MAGGRASRRSPGQCRLELACRQIPISFNQRKGSGILTAGDCIIINASCCHRRHNNTSRTCHHGQFSIFLSFFLCANFWRGEGRFAAPPFSLFLNFRPPAPSQSLLWRRCCTFTASQKDSVCTIYLIPV